MSEAEAPPQEAPAPAPAGQAVQAVPERDVSARTGLPLAPVHLSREDLEVIRQTIGREANPNDAELLLFARVCERWQLDPFLGEVYLIRYEQGRGISIQPGRDGMLKAARRDPDFVGPPVAFAVHEKDEFEVDLTGEQPKPVFRMGKPPRGAILGAFAICPARGRRAAYVWCDFSEFNRARAQWKTMPAHMIAKCAVNHSLKAQFGLPGLDLPENPDGPPIAAPAPALPAPEPPSAEHIAECVAGLERLGYPPAKIQERMDAVRTAVDAGDLIASIEEAERHRPPATGPAERRGRRPRSGGADWPATAAPPQGPGEAPAAGPPRQRRLTDPDMLGGGPAPAEGASS